MFRACIVAAVLLLARAAAADQILLTATNAATGSTGGSVVDAGSFLGARFHLDQTTEITEAGGTFFTYADGGIFLAIVKVPNATSLPQGSPFTDEEVMWSHVFDVGNMARNVLFPVTLTLPPGDYILVAGSGHFGATGGGAMSDGTSRGASTVRCVSNTWYEGGSSTVRFVLNGQPEPHAALLTAVNTRASQSSVDGLTTAIATRASQSSVDTLNGAISNAAAATAIAVNANVGTRASQLSVDAVGAAVAGKASQVSVDTANASLAGKASQASVDALDASVDGVAASVGALASQQQLSDLSNSVTSAVNTRASSASIDALSAKIDGLGTAPARLDLERAIATGQRILTLMLPALAGGQLENVRAIVDESIQAAAAAGISIIKAQADFAKGDAAATIGDYRTAYDWYVSAYQRLLK
jgi:hypothetical protein